MYAAPPQTRRRDAFAPFHWYVLLCCLCTALLGCCVQATKELPVSEPFDKLILEGIRCDVCELTIENAIKAVVELIKTPGPTVQDLTSTQADEVIESVCIPFTHEGEWLRRVELAVSGTTGNKTLKLEELEYYSDCKRTCASLQELCQELLDSEAAKGLAAHIVEDLKELQGDYGRVITDFIHVVCDLDPQCVNHNDRRRTLEKALSARDSSILREIEKDAPTVIEDAEREVEAMLYKIQSKGQKATVLTRKELKQLRTAIIKNNRAVAEKLDPSLAGVSDETFREIRRALAGSGYYYHDGREESTTGGANSKQAEPDL